MQRFLVTQSLARSESWLNEDRKLLDCGEWVTKSRNSMSLGLSSSGPTKKGTTLFTGQWP